MSPGNVPPNSEPTDNVRHRAATAPARYARQFQVTDLHEALEVVRQFDPQGIACRDLRECLLYQLRYLWSNCIPTLTGMP